MGKYRKPKSKDGRAIIAEKTRGRERAMPEEKTICAERAISIEKTNQGSIREKIDALRQENLVLIIENKDLKKEISELNKRYIDMLDGG